MTTALEGGEWSAACPSCTLPPGKTQYPFYSRLGGPQGRSGWAENLVPTRIQSQTVQPVVSRFTDWATRPTRLWGTNQSYHSWKFSKRAQHLVILGTLYTILRLLLSMPCTHIRVSIGTRLPARQSGVTILARVRDLCVSKTIRPHLGPIQPPIYGYHGSLPGVKWLCHEVYYSHQSSVRLRMSGTVSLFLQYAFMAWTGTSLPVPFYTSFHASYK